MEQCSMCKARFDEKWMTGHRCHKCNEEYGQGGDREKMLKESNPDLYPQHVYVDKKEFDELLSRVVELEGLVNKDIVDDPKVEVVSPTSAVKRGPGRPKKELSNAR